MNAYPWPAAFPINAAKARAIVEWMDAAPERVADLIAFINRPAGIVRSVPVQARLPV